MAEQTDKITEAENGAPSLPSASEISADEKLKAASALIKEKDKSVGSKKDKIEKLASDGEKIKERRIDQAREMLEENTERARAAASERAAILEYGSEYRKALIAREEKKAREAKALREKQELEEKSARDAERSCEIEAFKEKERLELEKRRLKSQMILEDLNRESDVGKTVDEDIKEVYTEETEENSPAEEPVCEASEEIEEKTNTAEPVSDNEERSERIILNIDPNMLQKKSDGASGENVIHIPPIYCVAQNADYGFYSRGAFGYGEPKPKSEADEQNYSGLSYEELYRDYYRGANELYNRELVDEYEKHLAENGGLLPEGDEALAELADYEAALAERDLSEYSGAVTDDEHADISIGMERGGSLGEDIGILAKTELSRRLSSYHKQESVLRGKLKKIESRHKNLSYAESVRLTVEKIGIHKEIVEVAIEALRACVYANSRVNISKHKKFLEKEIFRYNSALSEYETLTGRQLTRISPKMVDDIIEGRICEPIPNVYYVDDEHHRPESSATSEPTYSNEIGVSEGRSKVTDEQEYDGKTGDEEKEFAKEYSKRINEIRRLSERDVLLVVLRNEYKLSKYEAEYHMLQHSFAQNNRQRIKRMQKLDKKITKIRSNLKRSVKLERDDNRRYYYLLAVDPMKERVRQDARRETLDALKLRLEILLSERAAINERIIALYGGSDKNLTKLKIERKAAGVRRKYTKVMYKRQQRLASKVHRMKAPEDLKEKFFALLNKKTEKVAILEEKIYKLKKGKFRGKARRELERDVKNAKRAIKYVDADMKYLMKKLRRHQERYEDGRAFDIAMIFLSVFAVVCVVGWYFFGDTVKSYLWDIWTRIRAKF